MGENMSKKRYLNNPTINMSVGDKVVFNVVNEGMSFHAFGVTQDSAAGDCSCNLWPARRVVIF